MIDRWYETARTGAASTADDCSVTWDGERLDTATKLISFVTEYKRRLAEDAPTAG